MPDGWLHNNDPSSYVDSCPHGKLGAVVHRGFFADVSGALGRMLVMPRRVEWQFWCIMQTTTSQQSRLLGYPSLLFEVGSLA